MKAAVFALAVTVASCSQSFAASCDQDGMDIVTTPIIEQATFRLSGAKKMATVEGHADILLIGDSISGFWSKTQDRDFGGMSVVNMGLPGEQAQELQWRLEHFRPKVKPDRIVLIIGTNNLRDPTLPACAIATGISTAAGDIKALWPEARLFIIPILPRGPGYVFRNNDRLAVNRAISGSVKGATIVQIDEEAFTCGWSSEHCANYTEDNLHLSPDGYARLRRELERAGL
jgi:platelet-activating factor acetylhydrolase IB subunit beta/gamma